MKKEPERPKPPIEGVLYAEISAWITVAGMLVAMVGLIAAFLFGGGILDEIGVMKDLFGGRGESVIWAKDSVFASMPEQYWFFKHRLDADEFSMIGLIFACYGGVVGVWAMFFSTFRAKKVLFYKRGLYTFLALLLAVIMTLAATGMITLK
jgi:hypothetical protein